MQKIKLIKTLFVCGTLLIFALWGPQQILYPFRTLFGFMALPFQNTFSFVGFHIDSSLDFFASVGSLKQENEQLIQENKRLAADNARLLDLQQENESLRKQLDLLPRNKFDLQAAEVIGFDQQNAGNWILLNKGENVGIKRGMVVIVDQGVVVGQVSDVLQTSAKVRLLTSPESAINGVDVQTESKGVVRGQYGVGIMMDTILRTDVIKQGDDIVTSGLGGEFPRGLLFGKVGSVSASEDKLFQQAVVIPTINISKLRTVFVIMGNM